MLYIVITIIFLFVSFMTLSSIAANRMYNRKEQYERDSLENGNDSVKYVPIIEHQEEIVETLELKEIK